MAGVRQDSVQVKLEIEASQARTELDNLQRKSKVLTDQMKELKRGTAEYAATSKELRQVNKEMEEVRSKLGLTGLTLNQLDTLSKQLNRELRRLGPGTQEFIDKSKELQDVDKRLSEVRQEIKGIDADLKPAGGGFLDFVKKGAALGGIALGAEAIIGAVKSTGQAIFETTAKFEKYEAVLTTALGDKSAAQQAMKDIQKMAAETPFGVDELTASFIKFVNRGINPTMEDLGKLADLSASQGKSFDQLTEAVLDAMGGEFERLKEFGIKASKSGEEVELSFKGVQKTVANTPAAINEALLAFGEINGIMGSTDAISQTLEGQFSNMGDTADQAAVTIGQELKPVFVAIIATCVTFLEIITAIPAFLRENKQEFALLGVAILALNGQLIATTAATIYYTAVERARAIATRASAAAQALLNVAMTANPIGLVIAAVALLVAGFITLYKHSEQVRAGIAGLSAAASAVFKSMRDSAVQYLSGIGNLLAGLFSFNLDQIKAGLSGLGTALQTAGTAAANGYNQGYSKQMLEEEKNRQQRDDTAAAKRVVDAKAEAEKKAAAEKAASLAALKNREADIKAALAAVQSGSAEELRLKKLEVATKRDIELLETKKGEAEKRIIKAEAAGAIRKLQEDFDKKAKAEADKRAKEQIEVEKRIADQKAGLIKDEFERRIAQITAAAEREKSVAKGTATQIAQQRRLIDDKMWLDIAVERKKQQEKEYDERADIEKRKLALETNEYKRRAGELRLAASQELRKILDEDTRAAQKRELIARKLNQDLLDLERERVQRQEEVMRRVADIDADIAFRRADRARARARESNPFSAAPDQSEKEQLLDDVERQKRDVLRDATLNPSDSLAQLRALKEREEAIKEEFALRDEDRNKRIAAFALTAASEGIQALADFSRIASDKELAKAEKDQATRLKKLDDEYTATKKARDNDVKAGRITRDAANKADELAKEKYEKTKTGIEANASQETRRIKKDAAENEKKANIAQAVISTALAVIKALPNIPLSIATGVSGALGVAKIIATPIPEFEKGGIFGRTARSARNLFANGGRFNTTGGVPERGQLHGNGGIKMVDGATGEHLGEMERGEPYMILSRTTYANNRDVIDSLLDTSMYRGGARIEKKYETGGVFNAPTTPTGATANAGSAAQDAVVQELRALRVDVQNVKGQLRVLIGDEQIRQMGEVLNDQSALVAEMSA